MRKEGALLCFIALLALSLPQAEARTVVVNSQDWIDVYSGMLYARLNDDSALFLTTRRSATVLPQVLPYGDTLLVLESERIPHTANLASRLDREGFKTSTLFSRGSFATNLALATELNATRYVIVDPTYGFNAVSVTPYAVVTNSYVLFVDDRNIDQVAAFLAARQVDRMLIYGPVTDTVLERMGKFSPEILNAGNRYKDNIEILKRYFGANPWADQVVLTHGEFIESQLFSGEPVILIGRGRVLPITLEFARSTPLRSAVVLGNELTTPAKQFKDATGIPVFVKIGLGIPKGEFEYEPIKALDMFFLPSLAIQVDLGPVRYNAVDKVLEIAYRNRGDRAFLTGSIGIMVDGAIAQTIGDRDVQRLERNETRGFRYPIDLTEEFAANRNVTADIFTIYGEAADIQDRAIAAQVPVRLAGADDQCELELKQVTYNERTQRFGVRIANPSEVDCYSSISLLEVIVDDVPQVLVYPDTALIRAGDTETFIIKQRMTPVDLEDNPDVHVRVFYGEEDGLLFKLIDERRPIEKPVDYAFLLTVGIIAILIILIIVLFILWRRSKKNGERYRPEPSYGSQREWRRAY